MDSKSMRVVLYSVALFVLAGHFRSVVSNPSGGASIIDSDAEDEYTLKTFRKMLAGLTSMGQVAVSRLASAHDQIRSQRGVYDMVKNGTELGINVLSGLIKVDRVREPGKPRATSVRVFGIPLYNRGFRTGDVLPNDRRSGPKDDVDVVPGSRDGDGSGGSNGGSGGEEELPLE